jgi:hypothetical protein
MNNDHRLRLWALGAGLIGLVGLLAVLLGAFTLALGIVCGGFWHLASLWCLVHLLDAWLGPQPSRRHVIGWLLAKFPLLYVFVFVALRQPSISLIGFGIGFTVILVAAVGALAFSAQRMTMVRAHGR